MTGRQEYQRINTLTKKLVLGPAFFLCACGWLNPLQAQVQAQSQIQPIAPTVAANSNALAFDIEIAAPANVRDYLLRHIELSRYRELNDLDVNELARLLAAAELNVLDLLATLGYFSPQVQLAVVETPQNPGAMRRVTLSVEPGESVKVNDVNIEFDGAIAHDESAMAQIRAIRATWSLPKGSVFTQSAWNTAKADALRLLTSNLYPVGQIRDSRADIDPDAKQAILSVTLDSGPAYRLGSLLITGNQRFDTQLVTRLARLSPGSAYSQSELVAAQQRLSDSGFFDSVFVSLDTTGNPADAPILVQLREAKLQKIVFGVGGSTDSGLRLSVEHTHHKVPGIDWRAVSKLSLDRTTRSFGTELTSPPDETGTRWVTSALFQRQTSGSFDVVSQRYRLGRTQTGDKVDRNYYLQYDRAEDSAGNFSATANAITANYAWTQRNFDSLPFPSDGYGLGAELGGGMTLGDNSQPFVRAQARWLGLWSLVGSRASSRTMARAGRVAVRAEGGVVLAREGAELPSTQLFLTGGDTSVRGYAYRSIGSGQADGTIAAGRYLAAGSIEWQRPIVVNDRMTDWESTVFIDAGSVADKPSELSIKFGVGAGVRWRSPVGPLQMDLAYGVAVRRVRLHLNVGFTF